LTGTLTGRNYIPSTSALYDLGSNENKFNRVYTNNINCTSIQYLTSNTLPSGYVASAAGIAYNAEFKAFDGSTATYFQSTLNQYTGSTGVYVGANSTVVVGLGTVYGDWLQIQFPSSVSISSYLINNSYGGTQRGPSTFYILYSADGSTWNVADTQTAYQWSTTTNTFTLASPVNGTYFRLVCGLTGNTGIVANRNCFAITELVFNQVQIPLNISTVTLTNGNTNTTILTSTAASVGVVMKLPTNIGTVGQFLKTDGAGQCYWG
jgi:hypothetical protein